MSKLRSVGVIVALFLSASALGHAHLWSKVSQQQGVNGQVVCQWKCGIGSSSHYTTTSGYGFCPQPF